ncbi:MAG TPA: ACT domain-containing protein [Candidatus Aphodomonas merdavium]|nr:ACT domain-containing protein [Candidatus Aphodomonas merdavium]
MKALVTVIGRDQVGIIAGVCTRLAEYNINILDITQTVLQEYFTMMMVVDLTAASAAFDAVRRSLAEYGESKGLNIRIQRTDTFDAMHQI